MKSNRLGYAFLIVVLSISYSCNIQKRVEKQQQLFDNVGREWLKLHPCANDSFTIYVPGKRDSIPIEIPVMILDSGYAKKQLDSLQKEIYKIYSKTPDNCSTEIKKAYDIGYNTAAQKWKEKIGQIKVPIPVVDTLKITLKDKQAIQLLQKDLADKQQQINSMTADQLKQINSRDKWFLWFVVTFVLLTGSVYLNFKK